MASRTPRSSRTAGPGGDAAAAMLDRFVATPLAESLPRQRWFGSKGRRIAAVSVLDAAALGARAPGAWLLLVEVAFARGPREIYSVPLVVRAGGAVGVDAFDDADFCRALLDAFEEGLTLRARRGAIRFVRTATFPPPARGGGRTPRRLRGEQSHTSVVYDDALILKAFRKLERGVSPEHEMSAFLSARARFAHVPRLMGAAEYAGADGTTVTLAVIHQFVANEGDGWSWVLDHLARLRDVVAERAAHERLDAARLAPLVRDASATVLDALRRLGGLTGGLHAALASDPADPAFAPTPITAADVARWTARIARDLARTLAMLRPRVGTLDAPARGRARTLLDAEAALRACLDGLRALPGEGCYGIRVHGDYHLGQTLRTEDGFVILDFEGEPTRPLVERRAKQPALRDVAGMLRSLDYAAATALDGDETLAAAAGAWRRLASEAFLDGYLREVARAPVTLVPASRSGRARALAAFELDRALYEVRYEIDHRPAWLGVPLRGLHRVAMTGHTA